MLRPWTAVASLLFCTACVAGAWPARASAQQIRFFEVWSYTDNVPHQEIPTDELEKRDLGYWELEVDGDGAVVRGTYRGSDGSAWLTFRYVEKDGRVYADLFAGEGVGVASLGRKSTPLHSRAPRWPDRARGAD